MNESRESKNAEQLEELLLLTECYTMSGKCYFLPENKCAFPVFCSSERIEDKERIYQTLYIADE